jgi:hypothetical protein
MTLCRFCLGGFVDTVEGFGEVSTRTSMLQNDDIRTYSAGILFDKDGLIATTSWFPPRSFAVIC